VFSPEAAIRFSLQFIIIWSIITFDLILGERVQSPLSFAIRKYNLKLGREGAKSI